MLPALHVFRFSLVAAMVCTYASADIHQLEPITVTTATKTDKAITVLPTKVEIITAKEIENSGSSNLSEVLAKVSGFYVTPSGSGLSIRGMAHGDTLYLIDGKRVNGEFSKTYELDRIPAGMIERIEILKGTSSLLYGSDAMGGVVNVITKKAASGFNGNVQLISGRYKNGADMFVSGTMDKTALTLYANYLDRDAYSRSKNADIKVMQGGIEKSPSALTGGGNFGLLRSALDDSYAIDNDYIDNMMTKNVGGSISHFLNDTVELHTRFNYLTEEKDGQYVSSTYGTNYQNGGNTIMSKYVPAHQYDDNSRLNLSGGIVVTPSNEMEIKYDLSYSKYDKDRKVYTPLWQELGYASEEASISSINQSILKYWIHDATMTYTFDDSNRILIGGEHRIHDVKSTAYNVNDRTYSSGYIQHEYSPIDLLDLVYGVRYDKTSVGEDETSFSIGGTYALSSATKLKANYAQGFRSPDDRELYVNQTSPNGKKMLGVTVIDTASGKTTATNLLSETSESIEIGIVTKGEIWEADVALFDTKIDNRISQLTYANYTTFANIIKSEIRGIEMGLGINLNDNLTTKLTYSVIDAENKTTGEKLTDTPKSFGSWNVAYSPNKDFTITNMLKYTGNQISSSDNSHVGAYVIDNLYFGYKGIAKGLEVFAGIDNLFGKEMADSIVLQPERYWYLGARYSF